MPTLIEIGGPALVVALLALAQRLGGWEHKPLAKALGLAAAALFLAWSFRFLPIWAAWGVVGLVWSICLWCVFRWRQSRIDRGIRDADGAEICALTSKLAASQTDVTEAREKLTTATMELADARGQLAQRDQRLLEIEKEQQELARRSDRIWKLKRHAREIVRRWPTSDFGWYPAAKALWINPSAAPPSLSDSANNREWIPDAIAWHDAFKGYDFLVGSDAAYLNSLDFEELMEHLDREERVRRKVFDALLPSERPLVVAEYGVKPGDDRVHGFHVSNLGIRTAFDVKIVPIRLGKCRVLFAERLAVLDRGHGKVFLEMSASEPGTSIQGGRLFDFLNKWRLGADCWEFPLLLRIVYRDSESNWYMSTSFLEQDAADRVSHFVVCRPRPATEEALICVKG